MKYIKTLKIENFKKKINSHLFSLINFKQEHKIYSCNAVELLTPSRFDILAKYIYGLHRQKNVEVNWAKDLYKEHLRVWSGFVEGDKSGKDSFEKYLQSFNELLENIDKKGFDAESSLIPITVSNSIIDGSHRVGASLVYSKKIAALKTDELCKQYDYQFFKQKLLRQDFLDYMALHYTKLKKRTYIAFVFPIINENERDVQKTLSDFGEVVYKKEIILTRNGIHNLIHQMYKNEHWIQNKVGAIEHATQRYVKNKPISMYLIDTDSVEKMHAAKKKIRANFDKGNYPIHITDTHEEAVRLAEQLLNKNSLHFLNHANLNKQKKFFALFEKYKNWIESSSCDKDDFCIDSGSVLAAYGLRDTDDLDYLSVMDCESGILNIDNHKAELKYHKGKVDELTYNPNNYFYYDGYKFLSLENILYLKKKRYSVTREVKDARDSFLIKRIFKKPNIFNSFVKNSYFNFKIFLLRLPQNLIKLIMKCIPSSLKPFVRKCYYAFLLIKSKVSYFIEMLGPTERIIKYLGFNVYYSKGTSLIQRVKRDGQYEPEITQILLKEVCQKPKAAFLDIGANIGLISLNIHAVSPYTPIYAFEPGPHQAEYFKKTIKENNLTSKIDFYPIALSDEEGVCDFAVHDSKHASGDGFVDTGRAGTSKIIKVQTKKLDNWWEEHRCPEVGVVKIDTEGAELMVFKGGDNLIKTQKPTIFLEMQDVNLKKYPYDAYDILNWFKQRNYQVYTLAGDLVAKKNLAGYLLSEEMYCARFDAKD